MVKTCQGNLRPWILAFKNTLGELSFKSRILYLQQLFFRSIRILSAKGPAHQLKHPYACMPHHPHPWRHQSTLVAKANGPSGSIGSHLREPYLPRTTFLAKGALAPHWSMPMGPGDRGRQNRLQGSVECRIFTAAEAKQFVPQGPAFSKMDNLLAVQTARQLWLVGSKTIP